MEDYKAVGVVPVACHRQHDWKWGRPLKLSDHGGSLALTAGDEARGNMKRGPELRHRKRDRPPSAAYPSQKQWCLDGTHNRVTVRWKAIEKYLLQDVLGYTAGTCSESPVLFDVIFDPVPLRDKLVNERLEACEFCFVGYQMSVDAPDLCVSGA